MKSVYNTFLRAIMKTFIILHLYLKIRVINGLGKYTFFGEVWYQFIHIKIKVELAFESVRFFKNIFLFFYLKKNSLNTKCSKILLWNLLVKEFIFCPQYNRVSSSKFFDQRGWLGGGGTRAPPNNEILDILVISHDLSKRSVI